jgi:hypothetical protein
MAGPIQCTRRCSACWLGPAAFCSHQPDCWDGGSRRKLSKRHDPEASVGWYMEAGYPLGAVTEYLLNLIDGRFEDWRVENPTAPNTDFPIELERMSRSGALFDLVKLDSVSRDVVGAMSAKAIYDAALVWASGHDPQFAVRFAADAAYSQAILDIERHGERPEGHRPLEPAPADIGISSMIVLPSCRTKPRPRSSLSRLRATCAVAEA